MGKLENIQEGRNQGLALARRVVAEGGLEALDREIRLRGKTNINLNMTMKETEKGLGQIKMCIFDTVLTMALLVLHDEYDFGKKRLERFLKRWRSKTDCMMDGFFDWLDAVEILKSECGIEIDTDAMEKGGVV